MLARRLLALVAAVLLAACTSPADPQPTPLPGDTPIASHPASSLAESSASAEASVAAPASLPGRALDGEPLVACRLGSSTAALCGTLTVPEDPAAPEGRTIGLRVAVIPATAANPAPDPMVFLSGGPGGAATSGLAWTANVFRGIHATRDIVLVDQRGTGGSNLHLLDDLPDLTGLSEDETRATLERWIDRSLSDFDGDPRMYTTSIAMDDLDRVRAALGYDQVNLWGGSYGATAAQYYLRQHGDRVRSVVLDGATLIDVPIFELLPASSQRALDLVLARCAADEACAEAYPDPAGDLDRALDALEAGPATTRVIDPATGTGMVIAPYAFVGAVHGALLDASSAASLPLVLRAAARGDWDTVASAMLAASGGRAPTDDMPLMSAVIRCSEAWARWDSAATADAGRGTYLVAAQVLQARAQEIGCGFAPPGVVRSDDGDRVESDVPVLLVVGDADPQDPPANVAAAPDWFPNSRTLIVPGHGHTVSHLGCLPGIVDAFVEAGSVGGLDASCIDEGGVPIPPFRLP